jgi:hypothetical protein
MWMAFIRLIQGQVMGSSENNEVTSESTDYENVI